jgi:DNA-binding phage protein
VVGQVAANNPEFDAILRTVPALELQFHVSPLAVKSAG